MNTSEFNQYKDSLKPIREALLKNIAKWEKKVERTRNGSDKQREYFLPGDINALEALKHSLSSFDQVVRVLKEKIESSELLEGVQRQEICNLNDEVKRLESVHNMVSLRIINKNTARLILEKSLMLELSEN